MWFSIRLREKLLNESPYKLKYHRNRASFNLWVIFKAVSPSHESKLNYYTDNYNEKRRDDSQPKGKRNPLWWLKKA